MNLMNPNNQLHKVDLSILEKLRHAPASRYSDLMRSSDLDSDTFKFRIRALLKNKYIIKNENGDYSLTTTGKEFANNLDSTRRNIQKQPKLSVLVVVSKLDTNGELLFLFQQRKRNPYFDYWSVIGGPVQWGQKLEEAAISELHKQTGLQATKLRVVSFQRIKDYLGNTQELLEDKLFTVIEVKEYSGIIQNTWHGGHNKWMTLKEFQQQSKYYQSLVPMLSNLSDLHFYNSQTIHYRETDY